MSIRSESFGAEGDDQKDDSSAIQAAIDYSHENGHLPVQLLGETYILKKGLHLKEGVSLEMGVATKLVAEGNFNVLELEEKSSVTNGTIEVTTPDFQSSAIYISGKERVWTTNRIQVENVTLYNSSGSNKGEGISLTAGSSGEFISFMNILGVNVSGFYSGVSLEVSPPEGGEEYNFINGNRFVNLTLDDCIVCIQVDSSASIPNEASGNMFDNLQIQLTERTSKAVSLSGSHNIIEGMVWDMNALKGNQSLIEFSNESSENVVKFNIPKVSLVDKGSNNHFQPGLNNTN
ncbi:glycoside hydrolase family 55 protein [Rossellomorea vietnamensis]|uniref:glycoside hydrolase family 55 protein n=1 Tax=Rossellomorea vietnamensis TaxID=218284 RepID=UPI001CCDE311|nr:glycoside hydrolase family 55 protein [Rossellomorea vietnamensis]MCA0149776.1 glycoside hydrolase family 55 protein [Rossellomorea vietnamensis]